MINRVAIIIPTKTESRMYYKLAGVPIIIFINDISYLLSWACLWLH